MYNIMFFATSSSYATTIIVLSLLQYSCRSFAPPPTLQHKQNFFSSSGKSMHQSALTAVTKHQTFLLDGAELSYYIRSLASDHNISSDDDDFTVQEVPDVAPRSLQKRKRVASISFVTAVLDESITISSDEIVEKGTRIFGIEAVKTTSEQDDNQSSRKSINIGQDIHLYQDSIAIIPPSSKQSDADIISTAAASLLGVHSSTNKKRAVIVGGGDYAIFLAKALSALNVKTFLVTARPSWSLPSPQDILAGTSSKDLIEILPPSVGSMSLGFSMAIGEFDILIDTLGDEMGMGRARTIVNNDGYDIGQTSLQQWKELHGCDAYLSTVTRSQQYVLGKGLLFARDAVIRYQREVESQSGVISSVPPPRNFGETMQILLKKNIVYPAGSNEVGLHGEKSAFVRAWSLSDLTELKTWPRASEGSGRFGFPTIDLKAPRRDAKKVTTAAVEKVEAAKLEVAVKEEEESMPSGLTSPESMMETASNVTSTRPIKITKSPSKNTPSTNPHVTTIKSASELNNNIVEARRNCILFLSASYCQKCKRLTPQFQRMARKSSAGDDKSSSNTTSVLFAHVDISAGAQGKQLGKLLNVEKVPSVIMFQNGEQVEIDGGESSVVVERGSLNRLEEVVEALDKGESRSKLKELLAVGEIMRK